MYMSSMNTLPFEKRRQILHLMVEGNSIRGIARLVDVSPVTVLRQLEIAGLACARFHDENVRNVIAPPRRVRRNLVFQLLQEGQSREGQSRARGRRRCVDVDRPRRRLQADYLVSGRRS
jgi:transposase-like protein